MLGPLLNSSQPNLVSFLSLFHLRFRHNENFEVPRTTGLFLSPLSTFVKLLPTHSILSLIPTSLVNTYLILKTQFKNLSSFIQVYLYLLEWKIFSKTGTMSNSSPKSTVCQLLNEWMNFYKCNQSWYNAMRFSHFWRSKKLLKTQESIIMPRHFQYSMR